jgi:hypothetical protein
MRKFTDAVEGGLMNVPSLSGFSSLAFIAALILAPLQARADPNALWRIVHDQCAYRGGGRRETVRDRLP